jgi:hypothetical protein
VALSQHNCIHNVKHYQYGLSQHKYIHTYEALLIIYFCCTYQDHPPYITEEGMKLQLAALAIRISQQVTQEVTQQITQEVRLSLCICASVHLCICAYVHMCICAYVHLCII